MSRTCDWQNQLPINVIDYKKNCTAFVRDVRFVQYCTYMTLKHRVSKYFWYFTKKLLKIRSYLITISHEHHLIILLFFITGKNRRYHPDDVLFQNQQLVWYLDKGNRLELKKMIKSLQKSALWGREETNKLIVVVPKAASLTNEIGPSRILGNWLVYYIA